MSVELTRLWQWVLERVRVFRMLGSVVGARQVVEVASARDVKPQGGLDSGDTGKGLGIGLSGGVGRAWREDRSGNSA